MDEGAIGALIYARMRHGIAGRQGYSADWRTSAAKSTAGSCSTRAFIYSISRAGSSVTSLRYAPC